MTTLALLAFLVGPVGAVPVVPQALLMAAILRRPRRAILATVALTACVAITWLGYWHLWRIAFNNSDAGKPVPTSTNTADNAAMALCAAGVVLLEATAISMLAIRIRRPRRHISA
jgi:hypothetical protein